MVGLSAGEHVVVLRREGYFDIRQELTVQDGKIHVIRPEWKVDENALNRVEKFDIPRGDLEDLGKAQPAEKPEQEPTPDN